MTAMQFVPAEQWQPPGPAALFGELTADGQRIVLVGQGDAWSIKRAGEDLSRITPLRTKLPGSAVSVPATWAAVTQIAQTFTGAGADACRWVPGPSLTQWILAEFARRTAPHSPLKAEFPPWLKLREYQEEAASQIANVRKFLLLDEPGVGKTLSAIAGLAEISARGGAIFPMLIVVPSWGVATSWRREIAKWMPGWTPPEMYGGPKRSELLADPEDRPDIFITTYATARVDANDAHGPLAALRPVTVVGDEFHVIKSAKLITDKGNSTQSAAYRRICAHAENIIQLSGTPVTRDTGDTYPAMEAAWPGAFSSRQRYVRRYCETSQDEYGEKIQGLKRLAEPEFRAVLTGVMRRVAKIDVLTQLPPKIYSVRYVDIPPEWRKAYDGMEADMLAEFPDGTELPAFEANVRFGRLSQLACSAADVEVTEEIDELTGELKKHWKVTLKAPSWKADELLEIMAERRGQQVVSFTPSRQLAMIAGKQAEEAGYRVGYVTGLGNGITNATRQAAIDALQAGQLDLLSCTTGAGGTGITLTAARTAVFLQRPWLGESIQSEDRVHRYGSEIHEHGVEIIDIVANDSIDSRRRALLREHAGQLGEFVNDPRLVRAMLGGLKA